ncbi:MAG: (d)CMP kinase [Bacteroidetes bacterium]|nr:(d)CMP kinase [Bacteroidota bacterium]MBS1642564.1 (d)CMP kinase [Bacteroidota bacterium]MBS1670247.1 (d)CMP kinase [Bacteroidota bacterium]
MKKIVIAIDGYSSCGKSTMAKQLATALNYVFIDSGAMYRAITLYFLNNNIDIKNDTAVSNALNNIHLKFVYNEAEGKSDILLNNENVETAIREMKVSEYVSTVAAIEAVRIFAVAQQQQMGIAKGIVMDGRDIGTTVFPNAELKIFVTADVDTRVQRRLTELHNKGNMNISFAEVKQNLISRDHIDSTRTISPLRQAADALLLDNTHLTREEQLNIILNWVKERSGNY